MDETPQQVRDKIDHYRQLANALTDQRAKDAIEDMIAELDRRLQELENDDS
jgi:chaperonin cofactor prefoldin